MRELVRRHRIACFLVVTYAVTWGAWLGLALAHRRVGPRFDPVYLLGLVGPLAGAFATTAIADGRGGVRALAARMIQVRGVGLRWWFVALGGPFAVYAATYVVLAAYSMFLLAPIVLPTWASLGTFDGFPVTNAAVLLLALVVVNGLGEETGWRGFLLPELQRRHSPLVASLVVAACWGPWQLPALLVADTYRALPFAMMPMFFLGLVARSIVLTWLYNRGGGSVALAATFHGAYNLLSGAHGAHGAIAAVETVAVTILALGLVIQELRATRHERTDHAVPHVMAARRTAA